ncbi:MAG: hypothetical protein WCK67_12035 [bacterium]
MLIQNNYSHVNMQLKKQNKQNVSNTQFSQTSNLSFKGTAAPAVQVNTSTDNIFQRMAESFGKLRNSDGKGFISKIGKGFAKGVEKFGEFKGNNMSLPALLGLCFGIVLGARLIQARDKNERREVVTRDFAAVTTIIFALPLFKKATSFATRVLTGLPISFTLNKEKANFLSNLWPNTGIQPASFEQLEHWYNGTKNVNQFSKLMVELGGNLRKIFELVDGDAKNALNTIAEHCSEVGANKSQPSGIGFSIFKFVTAPFNKGKGVDLKIPQSTEAINKMLEEAAKSDKKEIKDALNKLSLYFNNTKTMLKEESNILKLANFLKSVPDAVSLGVIAGFLGWFLPWFNIQYTKKMVQAEQNNNNNTLASNPLNANQHPSLKKA